MTTTAPAAAPAAAPSATAQMPAPATAHFQSASLYVGDLNPDVVEAVLYDLFNKVGPVASIRVCRDTVTRRSLGYAYVNFHNVKDAERALDTMNFTNIKGRACRIMWSQRDPSLRKSGVGNIFVKNLPTSWDNKDLFDIFSEFGNILSGKVATDEKGESKGYGYVHFETAESANAAIEKLNNSTMEDCTLIVGAFVKRNERSGVADWTNLYVKQFPESWDDDKLKEYFGKMGEVANASVQKDDDGKSKKFGFVNFVEHASAEKALNELNGQTVEGVEIYISRAQKKAERMRDIKTKLDQLRGERISKFQGMNLYVKNVDDKVSDELFRETFAAHGTITSAKVMRDEAGESKGFGYVCYSTQEEATKAVGEVHGKVVMGKPLVVTLHQRKDIRRAHLAATMGPRPRGGFMANPQMPFGMPMMNNYQQMMRPGYPVMMPRGGPRGAMPGNFRQQGGAMYPPMPYGMPGMQMGPGGQVKQGQMRAGQQPGMQQGGRGQGPRGQPGMQQGGRGQPRGQPNMQQMQAGGRMNNVKFSGQARNQPNAGNANNQSANATANASNAAPAAAAAQQAAPPSTSGGLDLDAFTKLDPQAQKNFIGERLYPSIYEHQPELAGKITGMLLEMDNSELLNLLESPDALLAKIDEALQVLKAHQSN